MSYAYQQWNAQTHEGEHECESQQAEESSRAGSRLPLHLPKGYLQFYGIGTAAQTGAAPEPEAVGRPLKARPFNRDKGHNLIAVRLAHSSAPLYDGHGERVKGTAKMGRIQDDKRNAGDRKHPGRQLKTREPVVVVQGLEAVQVTEGKLAGQWLFYYWSQPTRQFPSGFICEADINKEDRPRLAGLKTKTPEMNNKEAPDSPKPMVYQLQPTTIPERLNSPGVDGEGRPHGERLTSAKPFGLRDPDHTLVTWSVPGAKKQDGQFTGAGVVRTIAYRGDYFYPCDVQPIVTRPLVARKEKQGKVPIRKSGKLVRGRIEWVYGYVWQNAQRVYGWIVKEHSLNHHDVSHVTTFKRDEVRDPHAPAPAAPAG